MQEDFPTPTCSPTLPHYLQMKELNEPVGWVELPVFAPTSTRVGAETVDGSGSDILRAHLLQICVVSMHQNGRDTHIRQVKVYGPRLPSAQHNPSIPTFQTLQFQQFETIR
ncbi:unnamed protein product [Discosporangium mesarthrocarpum]